MNDTIPMNEDSLLALTDAHDHARRALAAVQSVDPFCSSTMVLLDHVRKGLAEHVHTLSLIKTMTRVTP